MGILCLWVINTVYRNGHFIKNMKINTINSFVSKIISEYPDLVELWESDETQKKLKTLVNRSEGKRVKDPNAPKNAKSAYIFFCKEMRDKVKAELDAELEDGTKAKTTDITKALGARWELAKQKGDAHIRKYVKLAEEDKKRYQEDKADYTPSEEFLAESRRGKKDPNAPKHPQSAYILFCNQKRAEVKASLGEDSSATDVTRELGVRWNNFKASTTKKDVEAMKRFQEQAVEDKQRYETEKAQYEKENGHVETKKTRATAKPRATKAPATKASEKKAPATKSKAKATPASKSAPAKKSTQTGKATKASTPRDESASGSKGGYQVFVLENKQSVKDEHPEMKLAEVNKVLAQMWKDLSPEDQQVYKDQA